MASLQCYRQTYETYECQPKCPKPADGYNYGSSMGQNVSGGMTSFLHGSGRGGHAYGTHGQQPNTTTQCYSQTDAYNTSGYQRLGAPNHHGHQTGAYTTSGHQTGACNTSGHLGLGASNHHGHVGSTTSGHGFTSGHQGYGTPNHYSGSSSTTNGYGVVSCHAAKPKKNRGDRHRKQRDGDGSSSDSSDSDNEGGHRRRNRC